MLVERNTYRGTNNQNPPNPPFFRGLRCANFSLLPMYVATTKTKKASERKVIKEERFQKVLQSAMKQSLQYYLPVLKPLTVFKDFLNQDFNDQIFIAHCEDSKRFSFKEELQSNQSVTILIGPEGDFSENEIDLALKQGFKPVTLGNTRLRTETAAIAAVHSIVFINQ